MIPNRKSFLLYKDIYPPIKNLSIEDKGYIFDAILRYTNGVDIGEMTPISKNSFEFIKQSLDRDEIRYLDICQKNKENIKIRWSRDKTIQPNTTVYDPIRTDTKHTNSNSNIDINSNKQASKIIKNFLIKMGDRGKIDESGNPYYLNSLKKWELIKNLEKFMAKVESNYTGDVSTQISFKERPTIPKEALELVEINPEIYKVAGGKVLRFEKENLKYVEISDPTVELNNLGRENDLS